MDSTARQNDNLNIPILYLVMGCGLSKCSSAYNTCEELLIQQKKTFSFWGDQDPLIRGSDPWN